MKSQIKTTLFGALLAIFGIGVLACANPASVNTLPKAHESKAPTKSPSEHIISPMAIIPTIAKAQTFDRISFMRSQIDRKDTSEGSFFYTPPVESTGFEGSGGGGGGGPRGGGSGFGGRSGIRAVPRGPRSEPFFESVEDLELVEDRQEGDPNAEQTALEEVTTWKPAVAEDNAVRLSVGHNDDLPPQGMQISVALDGWRARVLIDAYFLNPEEVNLEGTFKLRLPEGASPYYFAFGQTVFGEKKSNPKADPEKAPVFFETDQQGQMNFDPYKIAAIRERSWEKVREARMVSRRKAAHAYHETTRRRIDPALLEWNDSSVFSARVFPLAPKQLHRIVIGYDYDIHQAGDDLVAKINVPRGLPTSRVDLGIHHQVKNLERSVSKIPNQMVEDESLHQTGRTYLTWKNPSAGEIGIRLYDTGTLAMQGSQGGEGNYRALRARVNLDQASRQAEKSHATFMLDTSYSTDPAKFHVWFTLLKETLANNRDLLTHFNVLFFSIDQHWYSPTPVVNNQENLDTLLEYCNGLCLEGATDVRAAITRALSPPTSADSPTLTRHFLLSDGAVTWGDSNREGMAKLLAESKSMGLYAFRTGLSDSDTELLNQLAVATGGAVFSVIGPEEVVKASKAFRAQPWKIVSVDDARGYAELIQGSPTHLYPDQIVKIVSKAKEGETKDMLTLVLSRNGKQKVIRTPIAASVESHFAGRAYGQVATGQLESLGQLTLEASEAYGRHFRVTRRTCSLLMLESEADYKSFGIDPHDDAEKVASIDVKQLLALVAANKARRLGSAKVAFQDWLKQFVATDGVKIEISPQLLALIAEMPEEAFHVDSERLQTTLRLDKEFSMAYHAMLESREIGYESAREEANRRKAAASSADQLKALSTLVENRPDDQELGRDIAAYASQGGFGGHAYHLLRRVRDSRPWEALTYHAMAKALREMGKHQLAIIYYEIALTGEWKARYGDFRKIVAFDYQDYIRAINQSEIALESQALQEFLAQRREAVIKIAGLSAADMVVTMTWNSDQTDIDLYVKDPEYNVCYYSNKSAIKGGKLTKDVTGGYGPEMFTLKEVRSGTYRIAADFFGNNSNRSRVSTRIEVAVHLYFGTPEHRVERRIIEMGREKQMLEIARVQILNGRSSKKEER